MVGKRYGSAEATVSFNIRSNRAQSPLQASLAMNCIRKLLPRF
jgi:hypothetical protein